MRVVRPSFFFTFIFPIPQTPFPEGRGLYGTEKRSIGYFGNYFLKNAVGFLEAVEGRDRKSTGVPAHKKLKPITQVFSCTARLNWWKKAYLRAFSPVDNFGFATYFDKC